jgi:hypothetical protein
MKRVIGLALLGLETPIERMARLWRDDPGIARAPRPSLTVGRDSFVLGVSGSL